MTSEEPTQVKKQYPRCRKMLVSFGMGASQSFELEKAAAKGTKSARKWIMTVWCLDRRCVDRPTIFHNRDRDITFRKVAGTWKM